MSLQKQTNDKELSINNRKEADQDIFRNSEAK